MPEFIQRQRARELIEAGAQVVEVLEPQEYEREHLPGAVNIPLGEIDDVGPKVLRRDEPVVLYCYDSA